MARSTEKAERLEARVSPEFKSQLVLAAHLEGRSVTDFIVCHLGEAARLVLEEHTLWKLSQADSEAFVQALLHPQPPSQRLIAAVQRYRKRRGL